MIPIDTQTIYDIVVANIVSYAPKLVVAIIVLVIGWIAIGFATRGIRKLFSHIRFDAALKRFLESLTGIGLKIILIITVAGIAGVETTSLVALLGAAGLAVGLALQGSLANFAGGVLLLTFKPFRIGDYIDAQGVSGTVKSIEMFNTTLTSFDNQTVVVPNGILSNGVIVNKTRQKERRLDIAIGVAYDTDIQKAREVALGVVRADARILTDPEPQVVVTGFGDSSVAIEVRAWAKTDDYAAIFDLREAIKVAYDKAKIEIPFPQRVVHMVK